MKFGPIATEAAEGAVLAHSLHGEKLTLKKGRKLTAADIEALQAAGVRAVVAARYGAGDVPEDEAAAELARRAAGAEVEVAAAFTGRVNLFAKAAGLFRVDPARVDRLNSLDEAVTIATLADFAPVQPGTMVATVKIIPFAAPRAVVDACLAVLGEGSLLAVQPYQAKRVRLIQTELPGTAAKMLDKTVDVTAERIAAVGGELLGEERCAHDTPAIAAAVRRAKDAGCDLLLVAGASAITDRRDVLPAGIEAAGGHVRHFGMPVDPGNLLLLAELDGLPVLGLPGCARSPKLNGFDWVLQRLAADLPVSGRDLMGMGVGGLLMEIASRPQPRAGRAAARAHAGAREAAPPTTQPRPKVTALLLAAGQSRRMGGPNKLLANIDGRPMVAHVAATILGSRAAGLAVVTGHQAAAVEAALRPLAGPDRLRFVHNPGFALGLSTSLQQGLAALPDDAEGALVCLGDMPRISSGLLDRLIAAFDPAAGQVIIVPTRNGRRGNPVLWGRSFWPAMAGLKGDIGARHLIGEHAESVHELAVEDEAALFDIDTPESLAAFQEAANTRPETRPEPVS